MIKITSVIGSYRKGNTFKVVQQHSNQHGEVLPNTGRSGQFTEAIPVMENIIFQQTWNTGGKKVGWATNQSFMLK